MISLHMLGKWNRFCCFADATLWLELLNDELYARFVFSSVLVLNPFMIQFSLHVYPGVHEQRDWVPPMMKKWFEKMRKILFCSFYIKQGMVWCAAIPDFRRFVDMTIRAEEYISVDILNPYPRFPHNEYSFDLKTYCTKLYSTVGISTIDVVRL
jgi:hypothetical protein